MVRRNSYRQPDWSSHYSSQRAEMAKRKKKGRKTTAQFSDMLTPACIPACTSTYCQGPAYQQSRFLWSDLHPVNAALLWYNHPVWPEWDFMTTPSRSCHQNNPRTFSRSQLPLLLQQRWRWIWTESCHRSPLLTRLRAFLFLGRVGRRKSWYNSPCKTSCFPFPPGFPSHRSR